MSGRRSVLFVLALAGLVGCSAGDERTALEPAGFLGDYSQLQPGRKGQAQLVFIDEETDFSGYRRVLLEPVVAWAPGGSPLAVIPEPERKQLAGYFDAALRRELALEFELVEETGPGTLRMRAAVTRAREPDDPSDVESSIEVEVLDAVTGQRLLAAVATRSEDAPQPGSAETGSGVHRSFDYWAEVIRMRLAAFRAVDAALAEGRGPIP